MGLAWLAAIGSTQPASAGSFSVNPVQISLPHDRQATSLTIKNSDVVPVSVRVQTLAWTQVDGTDRYSATSNLIVSPPIFTIRPGATQLVRIGLRNGKNDSAYRVILEEIPRQNPVQGQVQVTLRLNMPLYVLPKGGGKAEVNWRAWRDRSGSLLIEGQNRGTLFHKVTELHAESNGQTVVLAKQMGVILPGSSRIWKALPAMQLRTGTQFTVIARSPGGVTQTRVLLESR